MDGVQTLQDVFTHRLFSVPDYQRGYAWEASHRRDLLRDLELLEGEHQHYAGTLVLHEVPGRPKVWDGKGGSHVRYDVVDGQQRLTSLIALLDAIRRRLALEGGHRELAAGIRDAYVATRDPTGQPLFRLKLNRDCQEFWRRRVLADDPGPLPPSIEAHRRLLAARAEFAEFAGAAESIADLLELYRKLTNQLVFSVYEVGRSAEAGVIFEVMNNRGKSLSELDKVKNFLLYVAHRPGMGAELDEAISRTWTGIFERLAAAGLGGTRHEDQLLRLHWLVAYDSSPRRWGQARSIKGLLDPWTHRGHEAALTRKVRRYVDSLRDVAIAYCDANAPGHSAAFADWPEPERAEVRRWSDKLHRVGVVAPFLPLLAAFRKRESGRPDIYLQLVKACELFAFRVYRLARRRAHSGHSALRWAAFRVWNGSLDPLQAVDDVHRLAGGYGSQYDVDLALGHVGDWYRWTGTRYLLYEWEEHLAGRNGVRLDWSVIEKRDLKKCIEHVLPQTPSAEYWTSRFDPGQRSRLTHDLGNLVLSTVEANPAYSNRPFPDKKGSPGLGRACYADAALFQERELAQVDDWTPEQVERRRARIAAWARARWAVPTQAAD